jgi:hypothetical protein
MQLGHVAFFAAALCLYLLSPLAQALGAGISQHGSPAQGIAEAGPLANFYNVGLMDHGWSMEASITGLTGAKLDQDSDWIGRFRVQNIHLLGVVLDVSREPGEARPVRP